MDNVKDNGSRGNDDDNEDELISMTVIINLITMIIAILFINISIKTIIMIVT